MSARADEGICAPKPIGHLLEQPIVSSVELRGSKRDKQLTGFIDP
jgi:hypothetical protein